MFFVSLFCFHEIVAERILRRQDCSRRCLPQFSRKVGSLAAWLQSTALRAEPSPTDTLAGPHQGCSPGLVPNSASHPWWWTLSGTDSPSQCTCSSEVIKTGQRGGGLKAQLEGFQTGSCDFTPLGLRYLVCKMGREVPASWLGRKEMKCMKCLDILAAP